MFIDHLLTASFSTQRGDLRLNNSWDHTLYSTFISSLVYADGVSIWLFFQSESCFVEGCSTGTDTRTGFYCSSGHLTLQSSHPSLGQGSVFDRNTYNTDGMLYLINGSGTGKS